MAEPCAFKSVEFDNVKFTFLSVKNENGKHFICVTFCLLKMIM